MLSNNTNKVQCKENVATKKKQTPHSDDKNINDSDIEDKKNQCHKKNNGLTEVKTVRKEKYLCI